MGKCILAGRPPAGGQFGCGTYTGDGNYSQFINLGVTPKWVLVVNQGSSFADNPLYSRSGGLAVGSSWGGGSYKAVEISNNGFIVKSNDANNCRAAANDSSSVYNYIYGV